MRRFLQLFHVPEDGEVTEKHLKQVLVASLCSIFLCMSCLIGSTWALFQTTIVSEGNMITVGAFEVTLSLVKGETSSRTEIDASAPYSYKLSEVGTYNIFIVNTGSILGYCEIDLTDANGETVTLTSGTLYPVDDNKTTMDSATIAITVSAEDVFNKVVPVTLEITSHWGEDPNYEIADVDEELFMVTEPEEDKLGGDAASQESQNGDVDTEQVPGIVEPENTDQMKSEETTESTEQTQETEVTEETPESTEQTQETETTEETTEGAEQTQVTEATEETQEADALKRQAETPETEESFQDHAEREAQSQSGTEPAEQETVT